MLDMPAIAHMGFTKPSGQAKRKSGECWQEAESTATLDVTGFRGDSTFWTIASANLSLPPCSNFLFSSVLSSYYPKVSSSSLPPATETVLAQGRFCPQRTVGKAWRHFLAVTTAKGKVTGMQGAVGGQACGSASGGAQNAPQSKGGAHPAFQQCRGQDTADYTLLFETAFLTGAQYNHP